MEPYKGLRPYQEQDKDNFFGRNAEKKILIDKILTNKLTLLFAASGVGKSSVLQAAVMPQLKEPMGKNLDVIYHNEWFADPEADLKQTLVDYLHQHNKISADDAIDKSLPLPAFFHFCTIFTNEPLVIILDQFEEFFNYQRHSKKFKPFIQQLAKAVLDRDTPTVFVFSMREDFALELNAFKPGLPTLLFNNFYRLEKLSKENAQLAIIAPVEHLGFSYEPGLLDILLDDLSRREQRDRFGTATDLLDAPPFVEPPHLQIVCMQLWQRDQYNPNKQITIATYENQGRATTILKDYFVERVQQLSSHDKKLASKAFNYLVNKHGTKMAYPLGDLAKQLREDEPTLGKTLDKLEQARILRRQKRQNVLWYELYHDIFSKSIYDWNEHYKTRQRIKKLAIGTGVFFASGALLFMGNDWWMNRTHYHLRLSVKAGISDTIEVYQGKQDSADIFEQQAYLYETSYARPSIEADKLFQEKSIENYKQLNKELISVFPLVERIKFYWENGNVDDTLKFARDSLSKYHYGRDISPVVDSLTGFRSVASFNTLGMHLKPEKETRFRKQIITALEKTDAPSQTIIPLLHPLLKDNNRDIRLRVVEALNQLSGFKTVSPLVELLKDEDGRIRAKAASVLGKLDNAKAVNPLIELLNDEDSEVRKNVVEALAQLGNAKAIPYLIELLKNEQYSDIRKTIAFALGDFGQAEAINPLVELFKNRNWEIRNRAVSTLGKLGSIEAIKPLVERILKDSDEDVLNSAKEALSQLDRITVIKHLVEMLKNPDSDVRHRVVDILNGLGNINVFEHLVKMLDDQNPEIRGRAAETLGYLGNIKAESYLLKLLTDKKALVRSHAVEALGKLGALETIEPLLKLLKDQNPVVRKSVVQALGELGHAEVAEPFVEAKIVGLLFELLKDNEPSVRRATVQTLGELGNIEAVTPLMKTEIIKSLTELLKDKEAYVRSNAAKIIGQLSDGSNEIVEALIEQLKDEYPSVRKNAIQALGQFSSLASTKAIEPLIELLNEIEQNQDDDNIFLAVAPSVAETLTNLASTLGELGNTEEATKLLLHVLEKSVSDKFRHGPFDDYFDSIASNITNKLGEFGNSEAINSLTQLLASEFIDSRLRIGVVKALVRLIGVDVVRYLVKLTKSEGPYIRRNVTTVLGKLDYVETTQPLIELFKDENSEVRSSAVNALGQLSDTEFIRPLLEIEAIKPLLDLLKDEDVRFNATFLLAQLDSAEVIKPLVTMLTTQNLDIRFSAMAVLNQLNSAEAIQLLKVQIEERSKDKEFHYVAALGELGNLKSIHTLLFLASDNHEYNSVIYALESILGKNVESEKFLIKKLRHNDWRVRYNTAFVLGNLGGAKAVPPLIDLLKDEDSNVRESVVGALGQLGSAKAARFLIEMLKDKDGDVRNKAVEALGLLDTADAIQPLVELLKNNNPDIRDSAEEALDNLGSVKAIQPLVKLLDNQNADISDRAMNLLVQLSKIETIPLFIKLLKTQNLPAVQKRVADILGLLNRNEAVQPLIEVLKNQNSDVRHSAVKALGKLDNTEAVQPLIRLLKDDDYNIRSSAAKALGKLENPEATTPLIELLEDQYSLVRSNAAEALGQLDSIKAEKYLVKLLTDQYSSVRISAAKVLAQLGNFKAINFLVELLTNKNSDIRYNAAKALADLGRSEAVLPLIELLTDYDVDSDVIQALARLGSDKVVQPLIDRLEALTSPISKGRVEKVFTQLNILEGEQFLIPLLNEQNVDIRSIAAKMLADQGYPEAIKPLIELLMYPQSVYLDVMKSLDKLAIFNVNSRADEKAFKRLKEKSTRLNIEQRRKAAEKLGNILSEQSVELLISLLKDTSSVVKRQAIKSLKRMGRIKPHLVLPARSQLQALLKEAKPEIHHAAKEALNVFNNVSPETPEHKALEKLKEIALNQQERLVTRSTAIKLLGRVGTEEIANTLIKIVEQEAGSQREPLIVFAAYRALGNTRSPETLPFLQQQLIRLEENKEKWREKRDRGVENHGRWRYSHWETELGYAIAQIDPEKSAIELLNHDIANVRKGAWLAFGKVGNIDIVKKLVQKRRKSQPHEAHFRHAAYRAIDESLIAIEIQIDEQDLQALKVLYQHLITLPKQERHKGIEDRILWTIYQLEDKGVPKK